MQGDRRKEHKGYNLLYKKNQAVRLAGYTDCQIYLEPNEMTAVSDMSAQTLFHELRVAPFHRNVSRNSQNQRVHYAGCHKNAEVRHKYF